MPKSPTELSFRIIPKEEVNQGVKKPGTGKKALDVEAIASKFINPATGNPIEIGEAVEAGPFDSKEEGQNWMRYYLPDVYKHSTLNFGQEKMKNGKTRTPFEVDPRQKEDGKWYFWIIRVTL